jgi:hypothetical protein
VAAHGAKQVAAPRWIDILNALGTYGGSKPMTVILATFAAAGFVLWVFKIRRGFPTSTRIRQKCEKIFVEKAFQFVLLFAVLLIFTFLFSLFVMPIWNRKYSLVASISLFAFASFAISCIPKPKWGAVVLAGMAVLSAAAVHKELRLLQKESWKDLVPYVEANKADDDALVFNYGDKKRYVYDYYSTKEPTHVFLYPEEDRVPTAAETARLVETLKSYGTVWLVCAYPVEDHGALEGQLEHNFGPATMRDFRGVQALEFARKPK